MFLPGGYDLQEQSFFNRPQARLPRAMFGQCLDMAPSFASGLDCPRVLGNYAYSNDIGSIRKTAQRHVQVRSNGCLNEAEATLKWRPMVGTKQQHQIHLGVILSSLLTHLLSLSRKHQVCMRLGVNHGSQPFL